MDLATRMGRRLHAARTARGLSQAELAAAAGVSRQSVGACEAGRNIPRADAAAALAQVLGTSVEALVAAADEQIIGGLGDVVADSTSVRACRVGDRVVAVGVGDVGGEVFAAPDGIVRDGRLHPLDGAELDGVVVVGCDPAIGVVGQLVPPSVDVLGVLASSAAARAALRGGRSHLALVHDRDGGPGGPAHLALARWRTGIAATDIDVARRALDGEGPVIQREDGAGAQGAYRRALDRAGAATPSGPLARGHLDAARQAVATGRAAVTIEPAALSAGLMFLALETHLVRVEVAAQTADHPGVRALLDTLTSPRLKSRLRALPAYESIGA